MILTVVFWVCGVLLGLGALASVVRLVRGPSLLDRMIASDVLLVVIASALLLRGVATRELISVPFVLVVAAVAFLGSVTVARTVASREEGES